MLRFNHANQAQIARRIQELIGRVAIGEATPKERMELRELQELQSRLLRRDSFAEGDVA